MSTTTGTRYSSTPRPVDGESRSGTARGPQNQKNKKAVLLLLYAVAYGLLATIYVRYTSTAWSYMGLSLSVNYAKIAVSIAVLFGFIMATPTRWSARTFFLNVITTAYLLPSLILFGFSDKPTSSAATIWVAVTIVYFVSNMNLSRFKLFSISQTDVVRLLFAASIALVAAFFLFGGFRHFNLNFALVYEFRDQAAEAVPGIFGYLASVFTKVIIPFGVAISLYHRKYLGVLGFAAISILLFGFTSHKTMALIPFLSIAVYLLLWRRSGYAALLCGFTALALFLTVAIAFDATLSTSSFWGQVETLFVRRSLFIPAVLDYNYIEYFSDNPKYYWSASRLSFGFIDIPYDGVPPPRVIGSAYFGDAGTSANTGFIGSGFAQAALPGVLLYAVGVGLVIAFFQAYSRYMGVPLVATATVGLFTAMIQSTDFVTLFLTHGLLAAMMILAVMREQAGAAGKPASGARRWATGASALSTAKR